MKLFIAEKPTLALAIAEGLSPNPIKNRESGFFNAGDCIVTWAVGHMLEQANPDVYDPAYKKWSISLLPIIPEKWKMIPTKRTEKQLRNVGNLLKSCTSVVHAGDPDREGQLIIDEVLEHFKYKGSVERIWLSAVDPRSVKKALANLKPNTQYLPLKDSALARSRADWLVGMNLSRGYTLAAQKAGYAFGQPPISIGRVQTPVLALIVQREMDIRNFKPVDYFSISADIQLEKGGFTGRLKTDENTIGVDPDGRIVDPNAAKTIINRVKGATGHVSRYETKKVSEAAPLPFNLSSLQIYASAKWGLGAQKVVEICQSLYETHKITSYPRSDCRYLPVDQFLEAPAVLSAISSAFTQAAKANTKLKSKAWNDAKVTAHHGIIPTGKKPNMAALNPDEKRVYEVICMHYIAQFYPDYSYNKTNVEVTYPSASDKDIFAATGRVEIRKGWKEVLPSKAAKPSKGGEGDQSLPEGKLQDAAKAIDCKAEAKKTEPPKRFTEGTLIHAMTNIHLHVTDPKVKARLKETDGLGTEATRGGIIETIQERKMITIQKKNFVPTPMGIAVIKSVPELLKNPGMTALWEGSLKDISEGKRSLPEFLEMQITSLKKMVEFSKQAVIEVPEANKGDGSVGSSSGKGGSGKGGYTKSAPAAKATKPTASAKLGSCPSCSSPIVARVARTGANEGKEFLACSGFPKCKQRIEQPKHNEQGAVA